MLEAVIALHKDAIPCWICLRSFPEKHQPSVTGLKEFSPKVELFTQFTPATGQAFEE